MKKENIWAVLLGLGVIAVGVFLLWQLFNFSSKYPDQFAQHTYPKANVYMEYPTTWAEEDKIMLRETIMMISLRSALNGAIVAILGLLLLKIFAYSGWVVIKKAANKSWYMAAVPASIVLLIYFSFFSEGLYGVRVPLEYMILFLFFLSAIAGGWIAKHIQVK